jgi:hypothetical protein
MPVKFSSSPPDCPLVLLQSVEQKYAVAVAALRAEPRLRASQGLRVQGHRAQHRQILLQKQEPVDYPPNWLCYGDDVSVYGRSEGAQHPIDGTLPLPCNKFRCTLAGFDDEPRVLA